jgi:hypothetical protein
MALAFLQSAMRFDLVGSPPITPILYSPPWDFRPSFNPKSWTSGSTSVPSNLFTYIAIESTDQRRRSTTRPGPHGKTRTIHPFPAANLPQGCKPNLTKNTVFCLRSAQNLRLMPSASLTAECAWTHFQKNSSRASTHVATPFAGIASAATLNRK